MSVARRVVCYERVDNRWGWRQHDGNGEIIAVDGGQGYRDLTDALRAWENVMSECSDHPDIPVMVKAWNGEEALRS